MLSFLAVAWMAVAQAGTTDPVDVQILEYANNLRADLAAGTVEGATGLLPAGADLNELVWDPALAAAAQEYVDGCSFGFDAQRNARVFSYADQARFDLVAPQFIGSTLYAFFRSAGPVANIGHAAVDAWRDEAANYTYGTYTGNTTGTGDTVGSFTQVAWADTRYIGCGVAECPAGLAGINTISQYVVCNYYPTGNFIGQRPYEQAPADCPADRPVRVDGLCSGCPDPGFEATGSTNPPASCVTHPLVCSVDADCASLDVCADADDVSFDHTCVANECVRTTTACLFGSCALETCSTTCPDGDADGVCDDVDLCEGDDAQGDADLDGLCDPSLLVTTVVRGQSMSLQLTGGRPGSTAYFLASLTGPGQTCSPGDVVCVGMANAFVLGSATVDANGDAVKSLVVPSNTPRGILIGFQAVWLEGDEGAETGIVVRRVQ